MKTTNLLLFCAEAGFAFLIGRCGGAPWTGIAAFETRFFAVSHCRSLRGHTFCVNRKYAKSHKRGGDCDFPAPFETPPLNRQRGTVRGSPLIPSKGWQSFSKPASFFVPSLFFAKKSVGNGKHCTNLRGFQKGDRNPTSVVAGEGSHSNKKSRQPRSGLVPLGKTPSPCACLW